MKVHWKIGELAESTGLTVRTLRYYDQIGLLKPSHRLDNGYRLYDKTDIGRLQQILSLRQLGFSLRQIQACFGDVGFSLDDIVRLHLEQVRKQLGIQRKLLHRLEVVAKALQAQQDVTVERLLEIIEVINMVEKHGFDPEFTPEQLKARGEAYGPDKIREVEQEWPELIVKVQAEMDKGTPPSDEKVQQLAQRWRELVDMFTGGDPGIEQKLAQAYREAPKFGEQFGLTSEVMAYIQQAWE